MLEHEPVVVALGQCPKKIKPDLGSVTVPPHGHLRSFVRGEHGRLCRVAASRRNILCASRPGSTTRAASNRSPTVIEPYHREPRPSRVNCECSDRTPR